ncbi:hypothetical protein SSX86_017124 [Deinandra increscens subsp. villosa]|uniref:Integrase catalytic domain-containing protein n=1 Tax=Deinandra increscens subsp. villosa TaxID=3103831 RepID=A0AAP0GWH0_9ASTR
MADGGGNHANNPRQEFEIINYTTIPLQCPILTPMNYTIWSVKLKAIFNVHGLWETVCPLEGAEIDPKKDSATIAYLYQALLENMILQVVRLEHASEIWAAIKSRFIGVEILKKARLQTIKSEYEALRMKDTETIDDFVARLSAISSKVSELGEQIEEAVLVRKLLDSVPNHFIQIVASIEQFVDLETMKFQELIGRLKAFEERTGLKKKVDASQDQQVLLTYQEWQSRYRQSKENGKSSKGHYASECSKIKANNQESNLTQADGLDDEPTLLMISTQDDHREVVYLNESKVMPDKYGVDGSEQETWYLDNGASNHMTGKESQFSFLDKNVVGNVKFGDGSSVDIKGRGSIILQGKGNEQRVVSNVYYIPNLKNNILSLGQATENGCEVKMKQDKLWLNDRDGNLILRVKRSPNRLYKVNLRTGSPKCFLTGISSNEWLWHGRLGHVNFQSLENLYRKELVLGLPHIGQINQVCDSCMAGKQVREKFPSESHYASKKLLELVSMDLCGPIEPATSAGNRTNGIERLLTAPYSPQQNGAVERRNRSIMNMVRSLLKAMSIPNRYWAEAGRKPNVQHLRIFGCVGHVKVVKPGTKKLEDRSTPMVYLGVQEGSKASRMLDVSNDKIVISRDIRFEEKRKWDWSKGMAEKVDFEKVDFGTSIDSTDIEEGPFENNGQNDHSSDDESHYGEGEDPCHQEYHENHDHADHFGEQELNEGNVQDHGQNGHLKDFVLDNRLKQLENRQDEQDQFELLLVQDEEPIQFRDAIMSAEWKQAMRDEINAIKRNKTWYLTDIPEGHKPIGLKWLYKIKKDASDVKAAFLHGDLKETVYVSQPEGYVKKGQEKKVYKLEKALHGLKQAPRAWNQKLDQVMKELGFVKCQHEQAVYTRRNGKSILILGVYVDDLLVTGSDIGDVNSFKRQMQEKFQMTDLGLLCYYLGMEVNQRNNGIVIKQEAYAKKLVKLAGLEECNETRIPMEFGLRLRKEEGGEDVEATNYRRLVGSLRYLTHSRPDLSYSVGYVSRFMESPKLAHLKAVKQIIRYVKGTAGFGIKYERSNGQGLIGYSYSNHPVDNDDGKSTSGNIFFFNGSAVSWYSQKQKIVTLSSCEAEFVAANAAACQALWLSGLLKEITKEEQGPVLLKVDNKSAISLMKNPVFHGRSKHIALRYHFIRECIEHNQVLVDFVSSNQQKADVLTKALARIKFEEMRQLIGVAAFK